MAVGIYLDPDITAALHYVRHRLEVSFPASVSDNDHGSPKPRGNVARPSPPKAEHDPSPVLLWVRPLQGANTVAPILPAAANSCHARNISLSDVTG
jgi:hypothetical protein